MCRRLKISSSETSIFSQTYDIWINHWTCDRPLWVGALVCCKTRVEIRVRPLCVSTYILVSEGLRRRLRTVYALSPTDRVPFHTHTTHSATGASLSPGHVFGTVFRPTCATRTSRATVSGVNSKSFLLMLPPWRNETFVNCAI